MRSGDGKRALCQMCCRHSPCDSVKTHRSLLNSPLVSTIATNSITIARDQCSETRWCDEVTHIAPHQKPGTTQGGGEIYGAALVSDARPLWSRLGTEATEVAFCWRAGGVLSLVCGPADLFSPPAIGHAPSRVAPNVRGVQRPGQRIWVLTSAMCRPRVEPSTGAIEPQAAQPVPGSTDGLLRRTTSSM